MSRDFSCRHRLKYHRLGVGSGCDGGAGGRGQGGDRGGGVVGGRRRRGGSGGHGGGAMVVVKVVIALVSEENQAQNKRNISRCCSSRNVLIFRQCRPVWPRGPGCPTTPCPGKKESMV